MPYFDRFDILAAYNMYSVLWGGDGCRYENEIRCRLSRLKYMPGDSVQYLETLSSNAKEIYGGIVRRRESNHVAYERLHRRHPDIFPAWPGTHNVGSHYSFVKDRLGLDPACLGMVVP